MEENCSFTIKPTNKEEKVMVQNTIKIDQSITTKTSTSNQLISFQINGVEYKDHPGAVSQKEITEQGRNYLKCLYQIELSGQKEYHCFRAEKKTYSTSENELKTFRVARITKGMEVSIQFPSNVQVDFTELGTIHPFETKRQNFRNVMCKVHNKCLILPNQGYCLNFKIKPLCAA